MEEIVFKSQQELYDRLKPALRSKRKMLSNSGYKNLKEKDIWDCMRNVVWVSSSGLELCDMVDDILHTENNVFISYYHDKYLEDKNSVETLELPKLKS